MILSNIHIENFKGIQEADFTFSKSMNLIIGNNGAGKTSVLEAIAVVLGGFVAGMPGVNAIHFSKDEIRRETQLLGTGSNNIVYRTPIKVRADVIIDGKKYPVTRQKKVWTAHVQQLNQGIFTKRRKTWQRIASQSFLLSAIRVFREFPTRKKIVGKILFQMIFPE